LRLTSRLEGAHWPVKGSDGVETVVRGDEELFADGFFGRAPLRGAGLYSLRVSFAHRTPTMKTRQVSAFGYYPSRSGVAARRKQ
jgi:hypothetical protein